MNFYHNIPKPIRKNLFISESCLISSMADFFVGNNDKIDFQDLMGHRVHEILLVASPYDAFILEEDGHLTEQILTEYIGMNFNYAPRVTRVRTGYQAMQIIKKKKFDLVILMLRIEDQDPISLGKKIKDLYLSLIHISEPTRPY